MPKGNELRIAAWAALSSLKRDHRLQEEAYSKSSRLSCKGLRACKGEEARSSRGSEAGKDV